MNFRDPSGLSAEGTCTPGESVIYCEAAAPFLGVEFSAVAAEECPVCVVFLGWGLLEFGLTAWDGYELFGTYQRYRRGEASSTELGFTAAAFGAGVALPLGGAAGIGKRISKGLYRGGEAIFRNCSKSWICDAGGGLGEAERVFDMITEGLERHPHPGAYGGWRVRLDGGGTVNFQFGSRTGTPTISFHNIPNYHGPVKIHFNPGL